jgi:hypothetical protein
MCKQFVTGDRVRIGSTHFDCKLRGRVGVIDEWPREINITDGVNAHGANPLYWVVLEPLGEYYQIGEVDAAMFDENDLELIGANKGSKETGNGQA